MLTPPQNLAENSRNLRSRIAAAAQTAGRNVDSITLLAVSKGQPVSAIEFAAHLGLQHFGENYLQEALPKVAALRGRELTWHFIGQLQSNKTRAVAEHFAWVHTVDRLKSAERLAAQRPAFAAPLQICLQLRLGSEPGKGGAPISAIPALAAAVGKLPRLRLRGLMCVPPAEPTLARQRHWFAQARELLEALNREGATLDTLSMGMSGDLEAAVAEGATMLRIGTALFGPRAVSIVEQ